MVSVFSTNSIYNSLTKDFNVEERERERERETVCCVVKQEMRMWLLMVVSLLCSDVELRQRACWSFYRMSKEKIELRYERTPESVVPSLKELTARQILRISPSLASFSSTSSPTPTTTNSVSPAPILNVLPLELCHYLTKESRRCSHCGAPFFDHFYELLQFRQFREHVAQLPVFLHLCSHQCFQQVKTK
jgi:hypothetical protein